MSVDAREDWNAAAAGWEAAHDWYARSVHPLTEWFCDSVAKPGARVLDVACGTGQPALAIAARVGRAGRVVATDLSPAMVEATRRRADRADLDNVEVLQMDADALDWADGSFDATTCACGIMFCPDPGRVVGELQRVLVPGGRTAVAVWGEPAENPFFVVAANAIRSVAPLPRPNPPEAGPFRFAERGRLESLLAAAGFEEILVESLSMVFELDSVDAYWRIFTQCAVSMADHVATFTEAERARALDALRAGSEAFTHEGHLRLTATALCASGRARRTHER